MAGDNFLFNKHALHFTGGPVHTNFVGDVSELRIGIEPSLDCLPLRNSDLSAGLYQCGVSFQGGLFEIAKAERCGYFFSLGH